MYRLLSFLSRVLSRGVYPFLILVVLLFSTGAYHWAMKDYRTPSQTINPVMYPSFTEINVTAYAPEMRERYYRLWRTYDWMADGYAKPRVDGVYSRVPILYIHGNGGSYYCARSLARFVYESNARLRQRAMRDYRGHVKRLLYRTHKHDGALEALEEGAAIPAELQQSVEEQLIRSQVPILAAELFSVDFLEESSTHSAVLALKEARFLNHSAHLLMHGFLKTYAEVLAASPDPQFDGEAVVEAADNTTGDTPPSPSQLSPTTTRLLKQAEREYTKSVCAHASIHAPAKVCAQAKYVTKRFSTLERIRAEVRQVEQEGMWVWAESLGGVTALLSAIMAPHLYAGLVMVGTPTHYPPLFFDHASVWLFEVLDAAALNRYPAPLSPGEPAQVEGGTVNWEDLFSSNKNPNSVLYELRKVPRPALRHRLRRTSLLAINGGTLDDVVPSISGYLQRSTPRRIGTSVNRTTLRQDGATRRDVSTEALRDCGAAMDHRGLVYGLQFLQPSADSLVQAALLPDGDRYLGREENLPSLTRDRLFPTVVESLVEERLDMQREEILFMNSVRDSLTGKYIKETKFRALNEQLKQVCVDSPTPINLNDLPVYDEADSDSGYFDGSKVLHALIAFTTLPPDRVLVPDLHLFQDAIHETPVLNTEAVVRAATKLHLPTILKATNPIPGETLETAFSFAVYRRMKKRRQPTYLWPRFCMLVSGDQGLGNLQTHLQYDKINASGIIHAAREQYLGPHFVGNRVRVETEPGFALVRGVDSSLLEPSLLIQTAPGSQIFPMVMCGSLHSFYLALRGQTSLAPDEPEPQLQYYYGPYRKNLTEFRYAWKPFSTYPPLLNETYLIYTLSDTTKPRPTVQLPTYTMLESASIFSRAYWVWIVELWPQRWLASFSMYTGIARLGGTSILVFFTLFFVVGIMDDSVGATPAMRATLWRRSPFHFLRILRPMAGTVFVGVLIDILSGSWATLALKECLSNDPPPYISDAAMTARMSVLEKVTLVLLYGIWPDYRACRYSWIAMQGVPEWATLTAQLGTMFLGFILACALMTLGLTVMGGVGLVTFPLRRLVLMPVCRRSPKVLAVIFVLLWSVPTAILLAQPALPLCLVDLLGMVLFSTAVWMLPGTSQPGYRYRLVCFYVCEASIFPSHFDGLVLTIRNMVMLRNTPEASADAERYAPSLPQFVIFAIVQTCFAFTYLVVFCILRHEETLRRAALHKAGENIAVADRTDMAKDHDGGYVLGDCGRRFPRLRRFVCLVHRALIVVAFWLAVMALRRPIEGRSSLWGNMLLLMHLCSFLLQEL